MKIPAPPIEELTLLLPKPLWASDLEAYDSLVVENRDLAFEFMELLKEPPFGLTSTYIGAGWVEGGHTIAGTPGRYWMLEESDALELTPCEQDAVERLAEAGYEMAPVDLRVAHRLPSGWEPEDSMYRMLVGLDGDAYCGHVTREQSTIGVPFGKSRCVSSRSTTWAIWVAVEVE
jgi:hypothetical protein